MIEDFFKELDFPIDQDSISVVRKYHYTCPHYYVQIENRKFTLEIAFDRHVKVDVVNSLYKKALEGDKNIEAFQYYILYKETK